MSETITRFLAAELLTLRVRCGSCKAIVEIASDQVAFGRAFGNTNKCPLCSKEWHRPTVEALKSLVLSLEELRRDDSGPSLEFVVKPTA